MLTALFFPRQLSSEDLARVPANSTSNILNRLLISYDPRIRPNFKGKCECLFISPICLSGFHEGRRIAGVMLISQQLLGMPSFGFIFTPSACLEDRKVFDLK